MRGSPIRRPGDTGADWPVTLYFYPDDVESLHLALGSRGVEVGKLSVTFYRMKEFSCLDPDGPMLTFVHAPRVAPKSIALCRATTGFPSARSSGTIASAAGSPVPLMSTASAWDVSAA